MGPSLIPPESPQESLGVRVDDVCLLEQSSLITPVECLRLQLKARQRLCDKVFAHCQGILETLVKLHPSSENDASINDIIESLVSLRDALCAREAEESDLVTRLEDRVSHLHSLTSIHDMYGLSEWRHTRMKRLLVDYMLHNGHMNVANDVVTQHHLDVRGPQLTLDPSGPLAVSTYSPN